MTNKEKYQLMVDQMCSIQECIDLVTLQQSRQQFINQEDTNVLQDEFIGSIQPFVNELTEEELCWWGLIFCALEEIHTAYNQLSD